jgi:hypothetical protein
MPIGAPLTLTLVLSALVGGPATVSLWFFK